MWQSDYWFLILSDSWWCNSSQKHVFVFTTKNPFFYYFDILYTLALESSVSIFVVTLQFWRYLKEYGNWKWSFWCIKSNEIVFHSGAKTADTQILSSSLNGVLLSPLGRSSRIQDWTSWDGSMMSWNNLRQSQTYITYLCILKETCLHTRVLPLVDLLRLAECMFRRIV